MRWNCLRAICHVEQNRTSSEVYSTECSNLEKDCSKRIWCWVLDICGAPAPSNPTSIQSPIDPFSFFKSKGKTVPIWYSLRVCHPVWKRLMRWCNCNVRQLLKEKLKMDMTMSRLTMNDYERYFISSLHLTQIHTFSASCKPSCIFRRENRTFDDVIPPFSVTFRMARHFIKR